MNEQSAEIDFKNLPVSVVIATLGGDSLASTIDALNKGTNVPKEILVCIPRSQERGIEELQNKYANLKLVETECKGQVAQRAEGFKRVQYNYVMQLDDDIMVDKYCIERLLRALTMYGNRQVTVAPGMMSIETGDSIYVRSPMNRNLQRISDWLMNGADGYQPGKINKAGCAIGVRIKRNDEKYYEVEWLAGGCVMHKKENLILDNYYPFHGKAYYEDVIHSAKLRSNGILLIIAAGARCWLQMNNDFESNFRTFLKNLLADYKARRFSMRLLSLNSNRVYLYYCLSCIGYLINKIKRALSGMGAK